MKNPIMRKNLMIITSAYFSNFSWIRILDYAFFKKIYVLLFREPSYKQKYQYKEPEIVYRYPDHYKKPKSGYNGKYEEKKYEYKEPKYPTPESEEPEQEEPAEHEELEVLTKMNREEHKYKQERRQPTYGYTGYSWVQNREDYSNLLG